VIHYEEALYQVYAPLLLPLNLRHGRPIVVLNCISASYSLFHSDLAPPNVDLYRSLKAVSPTYGHNNI